MENKSDILIIGGGLAGLSLSILCVRAGYSTVLLEKSNYPKHKVCGEYISLESFDFMKALGLKLEDYDLPIINKFTLTSHHGYQSHCILKPGGIGISRYMLDKSLYDLALSYGVKIITDCKVIDVGFNDAQYFANTNQHGFFYSTFCFGAYGRISGLNDEAKKDSKFIGVKYHLDKGPAKDTIEIHNFEGGYCGISAIEDGKYCLCYLATSEGIKKHKGNIDAFEEEVLYKNKFLKNRFSANKIIERITTSQLYFGVNKIDSHYPLLGDAAGFIPPITGNGMSLAFRSAKQSFEFLQKSGGSKEEISKQMTKYNNFYLYHRINKGIILQDILFMKNKLFNKALMLGLTMIPGMMTFMTKQAVGKNI